jgi:hypothetical protein
MSRSLTWIAYVEKRREEEHIDKHPFCLIQFLFLTYFEYLAVVDFISLFVLQRRMLPTLRYVTVMFSCRTSLYCE